MGPKAEQGALMYPEASEGASEGVEMEVSWFEICVCMWNGFQGYISGDIFGGKK